MLRPVKIFIDEKEIQALESFLKDPSPRLLKTETRAKCMELLNKLIKGFDSIVPECEPFIDITNNSHSIDREILEVVNDNFLDLI